MTKVNQILNRSGLALIFLASSCLNLDDDKGFLVVTNAQVYNVGDTVTLRIRSGATGMIHINLNCSTNNDTAGFLVERVVNNEFVEPTPPESCEDEPYRDLIPLRPNRTTTLDMVADTTGEFRYRILFYVAVNEGYSPAEPFFYSNSFLVR
jgi:hypothetical protein